MGGSASKRKPEMGEVDVRKSSASTRSESFNAAHAEEPPAKQSSQRTKNNTADVLQDVPFVYVSRKERLIQQLESLHESRETLRGNLQKTPRVSRRSNGSTPETPQRTTTKKTRRKGSKGKRLRSDVNTGPAIVTEEDENLIRKLTMPPESLSFGQMDKVKAPTPPEIDFASTGDEATVIKARENLLKEIRLRKHRQAEDKGDSDQRVDRTLKMLEVKCVNKGRKRVIQGDHGKTRVVPHRRISSARCRHGPCNQELRHPKPNRHLISYHCVIQSNSSKSTQTGAESALLEAYTQTPDEVLPKVTRETQYESPKRAEKLKKRYNLSLLDPRVCCHAKESVPNLLNETADVGRCRGHLKHLKRTTGSEKITEYLINRQNCRDAFQEEEILLGRTSSTRHTCSYCSSSVASQEFDSLQVNFPESSRTLLSNPQSSLFSSCPSEASCCSVRPQKSKLKNVELFQQMEDLGLGFVRHGEWVPTSVISRTIWNKVEKACGLSGIWKPRKNANINLY